MTRKVIAISCITIQILLLSVSSRANNLYSISEVRALYGKGVDDAGAAKKLMQLLSPLTSADPLLFAYKGGAEALEAKHAWNPYTKLNYLSKSMSTLDQAIKVDPENAEIRFIRFSIQYHIPQFLGYSKNLDEDAHMIAENFFQLKKSLDQKTLQDIAEFLNNSGSCSISDSQIIRGMLE